MQDQPKNLGEFMDTLEQKELMLEVQDSDPDKENIEMLKKENIR